MMDVRKKQQGSSGARWPRSLASQQLPPRSQRPSSIPTLTSAAEAVIRMLHFNAAPAVKAAPGDEDVYKVLILDRHTKVRLGGVRGSCVGRLGSGGQWQWMVEPAMAAGAPRCELCTAAGRCGPRAAAAAALLCRTSWRRCCT